MDVETWCAQNNLTKANYYYRLRRVREVCLEQFQATDVPTFVELPVPKKKTVCEDPATKTTLAEKATPVLRIKSDSGLCVEVFSDISPTLLQQAIEAMDHAK
ncbi:MAG: IS66 family insertion sequence element accessory protein TnpB [Anaerosacchariphilus sp.]